MRHGWTKTVAKFAEVEKYARGSCTSSIGIYKGLEASLPENNEFLIINFGLSEHSELQSKAVDSEHLAMLVDSLYDYFRSGGNHTLSVMFPLRSSLDLSYDLHKNACERTGGFFIDGYLFINEIIKNCPTLDPVSLYRTPNDRKHLKPAVANFLGLACLETMNFLKKEAPEPISSTSRTRFEIVNAQAPCFEKFEKHRFGSGRYSEEVLFIEKGDNVEIPYNGYLHALYVDSENSETHLQLVSNGICLCKSLANIKLGRDKPLFKMLTLERPFKVVDKLVVKNVGAQAVNVEFTRNERKIEDSENSRGVIAGFLMSRNSEYPEYVPTAANGHEALQQSVDEIVREAARSLSDCLTLIEPSVIFPSFHTDKIDIAKSGDAKQSSLSKWSKKDDPQRAVLDLPDEYAFHTKRQINPWWYLQFECSKYVDLIVIENRRNSRFFARAFNLRVEIFDELFVPRTILEGQVEFGTYSKIGPLVIPVGLDVKAVKITALGKSVLHLASVKIYE